MSTEAWFLISLWSLFAMALIWRQLNLRTFHKELQKILDEAVRDKLNKEVNPAIKRLLASHIENYLVESKVVDRAVQFRWTKK